MKNFNIIVIFGAFFSLSHNCYSQPLGLFVEFNQIIRTSVEKLGPLQSHLQRSLPTIECQLATPMPEERLELSVGGYKGNEFQFRPTIYRLTDQVEFASDERKTEITLVDNIGNKLESLKVPRSFYYDAMLQGSGILRHETKGPLVINYDGGRRFEVLQNEFRHGRSATGTPLIPYHTAAGDITGGNSFKPGTVLYVPSLDGILLPNNRKHNGILEVSDTGGDFQGTGKERLDIFINIDKPEEKHPLVEAGFADKGNRFKAIELRGDAANKAKSILERMRED